MNGEAIYETRAVTPYKEGKVCFTKKKDKDIVYAIYLSDENKQMLPSTIQIKGVQPANNTEIFMLGIAEKLNWEKVGDGFVVEIPEALQKNPPCKYAWTIKISQE